MRTLRLKKSAEPSTTSASARGSGARLSLRLPIDGSLDPILGLLPDLGASQGLGTKRHALSRRGLGAPWRCPLGAALSTAAPTSSSAASRGSRASRPMHQPLDPASFATKKSPEGTPGEGRSKPTQPDTQRVRTEQLDNAQGFFSSTTSPRSTEHCYKTLLDSAHVDHRIIPQTRPISVYKG
jgi:hypothetical protein